MDFPVLSIEDIKLSQCDAEEANKEKLAVKSYSLSTVHFFSYVDKEIKLRYKYSNYIINPNKYRFRKVLRILG